MLISMYFCLLNLPFVEANLHFHLYHSDRVSDSELYHDCLLYNGAYPYPNFDLLGGFVNRPYQLIPYCIRKLNPDADASKYEDISSISGVPITFQSLKDRNITSEILYLSSIPIDVVERYQAFLENPQKSFSEQKVYNCTIPWFGQFCQFSFNLMKPFPENLRDYFRSLNPLLPQVDPVDYTTCYTFIKCDRGPWPSCLDWREICNGEMDCLNGGIDELGCDELDTIECAEDGYRCANSFCIPESFFNDDMYNPDCMDASDEKHNFAMDDYSTHCINDPSFRCEERSCRHQRDVACGNGNCQGNMCKNERDVVLSQAQLSRQGNPDLSFEFWMNLICLTLPANYHTPVLNLTVKCPPKLQSKSSLASHCPEHFFFPAQPIVLGHVRFLYESNAIFPPGSDRFIPSPSYVCYDQHLCESISPTMRFNESACLLFSAVFGDEWNGRWLLLEKDVADFFARCLLTEKVYAVCPSSKPYRCANSSKCLSLNRLMDGVVDCMEEDDEQIAQSCLLPDQRFRFKCLSDNVCKDIRSIDYNNHMCKISGEWTGERNIIYGDIRMIYPPSFATVCNGFIDHMLIDRLNYTDETNCEQWPRNNIYTRCDDQGIWNCLDGSDEVDCPRNPCRPHGHPCISVQSNSFICLPLTRINDGTVDCLGGYDERAFCRTHYPPTTSEAYRCFNETKCIPTLRIYEGVDRCSSSRDKSRCKGASHANASEILEHWNFNTYLDSLNIEIVTRNVVYFSLENHLSYPLQNATATDGIEAPRVAEMNIKNVFSVNPAAQATGHPVDIYCKREIRVYLEDLRERHC